VVCSIERCLVGTAELADGYRSDGERYEALVLAAMRAVFERAAEVRGLEVRVLKAGRLWCDSASGLLASEASAAVGAAVGADVGDAASIGRLYETLIAHVIERRGSRCRLVPGRQRKASGSFYTPQELARTLADAALASLLKGTCALPAKQRAQQLVALRVCDPAMGAGAFLVEIAARLSHVLGELSPDKSPAAVRSAVVQQCLYGMDVNPSAVAITEAALWIFAANSKLSMAELGNHLWHADALDDEVMSRSKAEAAGHRTLAGQEAAVGSGFNLVIGNPPWLAFAGRATQPLSAQRRAFFANRFSAWHGYPTLHSLFIERAAELAPAGTVALLLPSPVADLRGYAAARRVLTKTHLVSEPLLEFGQDAFAGVTQPCFALVAEPRQQSTIGSEDRWSLVERQRAGITAELLRRPAVLELLLQAEKLPRELFREMGFQSTRRATERLLRRADEPDEHYCYPLLEGRDVREFREGPARLFLNADPAMLAWAGCRARPCADYGRVGFVVRQTAKVPIAAQHSGLPFRNSLLAGVASAPYQTDFLVGLLNSALYRALHIAEQRDARQAVFPQVKLSHLRSLPRPPFCGERWERIAALAAAAWREQAASVELRTALDREVFELFGVPADHSAAVLAFLGERAPELHHTRPEQVATPTSSLEALINTLRIG
jgi:hypothetical protein